MTDSPPDPQGDASLAAEKPLIEVGLILAGQLDPIDREAIEIARERAVDELRRWFPEFTWGLIIVERNEMTPNQREQPATFFSRGQTERDLHKWDYVFVITSSDLFGHYKPYSLAAVSRTLDLAILSTARVDPRSVDASVDREWRVIHVAHRMCVLMLHCLGHINGLEHADDPGNLMWDADSVPELDHMTQLTDDQRERMESNLREIAGERIEERAGAGSRSQLLFMLHVAWAERREILAGVVQATPWRFPILLSRLTTAAFSAMLVLLMTAETWDMSMSQSATSVGVLVCVVLMVTTAYVVTRQRLLVRRIDQTMTEQIAVSNITATLIVLSGMITTLLVLYCVSLGCSLTLFTSRLVTGWAASVVGDISLPHHLLLSGVVSSLSIAIGALGAAFEDQSYFRHVIFVDEEV